MTQSACKVILQVKDQHDLSLVTKFFKDFKHFYYHYIHVQLVPLLGTIFRVEFLVFLTGLGFF